MKEYQPYAISNFRSGFDKSVQPWLIPRDAYQTMENAHLYLGVLEKITGYTLFARMTYRTSFQLGALGGGTGVINGINASFTGVTPGIPKTNNITIQSTTNAGATTHETFTDPLGTGVLSSTGGGTGTLNYTTGAVSVTFGTAPADLTVGGVQYNSVVMSFDSGSPGLDIMGIKQYIGDTGTQEVLIFDTRRVGKIVPFPSGSVLIPTLGVDNGVSEIPHEVQFANITTGFNNTMGPFTGTIAGTFFVPGEVTFRVFSNAGALLDTITDNGSGLLSGATLNAAGSNFINYATGQWILTFSVNQPASNTVNFFGCVYGDVFTGDFTNFFSTTNYTAKTFITNNKDPIRYYDGICIKYLNTNLTAKPTGIFSTYDITSALHVVAYRERLVLLSYVQNGIPAFNAGAWSVAGNPLDFTNAEFAVAPTSDNIRSIGLINFDLVVDMQGTTWVLRYTNDAFAPFRWDRINNTWRHDASYSGINYDTYMSSIGKPAITASDALNVYRADEIIPDFTFTSMDQNSLQVCYGERFDDFKEGWLCFPSVESATNAVVRSDTVLAYNYLDETYAVYDFPFSCLGFGRVSRNLTWADIQQKWEDYDVTWGSSFLQDNRLIDLAGDHHGNVFELGTGNTLGDGTTPVTMNVVTKNFNPFVEEGELARFGYLDLYVTVVNETKLKVQFYINDELDDNYTNYYLQNTLTFTPNTDANETKEWKRVYVGAVGQIHTIRLFQDTADFTSETLDQPVKIHSMVLWMKRAGRIYS